MEIWDTWNSPEIKYPKYNGLITAARTRRRWLKLGWWKDTPRRGWHFNQVWDKDGVLTSQGCNKSDIPDEDPEKCPQESQVERLPSFIPGQNTCNWPPALMSLCVPFWRFHCLCCAWRCQDCFSVSEGAGWWYSHPIYKATWGNMSTDVPGTLALQVSCSRLEWTLHPEMHPFLLLILNK